MNYWIDLFTGTTWDEFRKDGASVSGFRHRMRNTVSKIQQGDILLCYMTGVMRWVGALEVLGPSDDKRHIWSVADFPVRLTVRPLVMLDAENGVPMEHLEGRVEFYEFPADRGKFKGFLRGSPRVFKRPKDGDLLVEMLRGAEKNPVARPVDPAKLARKPLFKVQRKKGRKAIEALVSIPEREDIEGDTKTADGESSTASSTQHVEIQYRLLRLGSDMGFNVWVARNDRGKTYNGETLGNMSRMVEALPTQFNEATNKTIELIDVLWLKGNSIVAAFELECTTAIYSGLLRMSDLLALQPNLNIKLYIVAPDERRDKIEREIMRPTFNLREKPLSEICGFLPISDLTEKIKGIQKLGLTSSMKPDFLEQVVEYFTDEE